MYQTIKVRIRLSKCQKDYLLKYETIYHEEIDKIYSLLNNNDKIISFKRIRVTKYIKEQSHWALYQIALRKYKRKREGKQFTYQKSSTWSPLNTLVRNNLLFITYGILFPISNDALCLCANDKQLFAIGNHEIIRIDFIHDEMVWFVNFLIRV